MSDGDIFAAIERLDDMQERQHLLSQFEREGRSLLFWEAILAAVARQHLRTPGGPLWGLLYNLERARIDAT